MPHPADLRDERFFPDFGNCPGEDDANLEYFTCSDGLVLTPARHWCLLAEIMDVSTIIRVRLIAKDKSGKQFPIAFYLDSGMHQDFRIFRKGHTVAILYAEQHYFLDMTVGIRQEDITSIQVIPLSLSRLLDLSDKVRKQGSLEEGKKACHSCEKREASLLKCGKCGLFWYCNKTCQGIGWRDKGHKEDCEKLRDLAGIFNQDWETFEDFVKFPL